MFAKPLLTPMQAAAANNGRNKDLLKSVIAQARRMNFAIDMNDKHIDTMALDAAMKNNPNITERLAIKSALAKLNLIP